MFLEVYMTCIVCVLTATLEYYSDRDGTFECVATGGSPKPTVKVLIGDKNIAALKNLYVEDNKELRGDVPGLQYYEYTVKRHSKSFRLDPADDGKTLRCAASVQEGVAATETSVKLHVIGRFTETYSFGNMWVTLLCINVWWQCIQSYT